ncbi:sigma-70 family RNA polymerase sigma factor [Kitasatospora sp. CMC57]
MRAGHAHGRQQPTAELSAAVLERVARGDKQAFEELYHRIAGPVYGMALRTLRDRAHAEEVAQEVLLEIWRTAATYRSDRGSVTTWALTIAHRRAVDRVRSVRASTERDDRIARQDPADSEALEDRVVRSIEQARVRSALAGLSQVQREAVVLAYYGGYSQREIAALTHTPLGTVKTRVRDGLLRLRSALGLESSRGGESPQPTETAATERRIGGA